VTTLRRAVSLLLSRRLRRSIFREIKDERGSAVVEFVVLTIPLFIPFALYLGFLHGQTQASFDAHNLARQAARAFITSPSQDLAQSRVDMVVQAFASHVLSKDGISANPLVTIQCSATPCLTPGASVEAKVTMSDHALTPSGYLRFINSGGTQVTASDTQVVDIWRNTN
jgi:Flp pilus assembly protein TadG